MYDKPVTIYDYSREDAGKDRLVTLPMDRNNFEGCQISRRLDCAYRSRMDNVLNHRINVNMPMGRLK